MINVYDQHDAAFKCVSAYAVLDGAGEYVGKVLFKHPKDGAGRLYCYMQVFGAPMVRGFATGGGYDKRSASAHVAAKRLTVDGSLDPKTQASVAAFRGAIKDEGARWDDDLIRAGFRVLTVI